MNNFISHNCDSNDIPFFKKCFKHSRKSSSGCTSRNLKYMEFNTKCTSSLKLRKSYLILQMNTKKMLRCSHERAIIIVGSQCSAFFTFLPSRLLTTCLPIHHPTTITNLTHFLQDLALLRRNSSV